MRRMRTDDFDFELPKELIAQQPAPRGTSRLLVLDRGSGSLAHLDVGRLPELLQPDDLLLLNDTRVIPARLHADRSTGRTFELLLLRPLADGRWESLLRPSARARIGERLELADGGVAIPEKPMGEGRWAIRFEPPLDLERLDHIGEMPLPPYIERPDGGSGGGSFRLPDGLRRKAGSGGGADRRPPLHRRTARRRARDRRGNGLSHPARGARHIPPGVGRRHRRPRDARGVVSPVSNDTVAAVNRALDEDRRIVCVGTTSVRALEGALAAGEGRLEPGEGWTRIFITPGFEFRGVGALLTNFHLPRSTLLMLVSAFAGREQILAAYAEAIKERYRFFSYGDAMLIV